ncbi:hypothetical protein ACFLX5_05880 [Chloroflexota bacterium]
MAFRLVKTGKSYSEQRDGFAPGQGNTRPGSLPEGYHLKYSDTQAISEELNEIVARVRGEGYVLLWSTVLEDSVAFYKTEADRQKIPPGFVPYSDQELWGLFGEGKAAHSPDKLRLIHEAKKKGARITGSEPNNQEE